jgi:threonine dehydratase
MSRPPTLEDIRQAARRIRAHVHRTPLATSSTLDREFGARVWFKCENLQKVGAFKARGACNAVMALTAEDAVRGVLTHSSGNHAAALAWAAGLRGIPCTVVMPEVVPRVKREAVEGYGAKIVACAREHRQATCDRLAAETGQVVVHPYTNSDVIAGQGTAALELIEEVGDLDLLIAPVGGGGLSSGSAIVTRALLPRAAIWGAEPRAADDAYRSLASGALQPAVENPRTLADGLMAGLGAINFAVLRDHSVEIVPVDEDEIVRAARFVLERLKLVIEPSAATVLAALRARAAELKGMRIGAILSGGNTDFAWLK